MNAIIESLETHFGGDITNDLMHSQNRYVVDFMMEFGLAAADKGASLSDYQELKDQLITSNPFASESVDDTSYEEIAEAFLLMGKLVPDGQLKDFLLVSSYTVMIANKANNAHGILDLEINDQSKLKLMENDANKIKDWSKEFKKIKMPHGLKGKFKNVLRHIEAIEYSFRAGNFALIARNNEYFSREMDEVLERLEIKVFGEKLPYE
ncbi:hypothetical protein [Shouchella patagoniensis]|uniref:hypothetical protein n=1 Tax=Shouchella patagoniensis TaxID=228576 RepID=UPI000995A9BF|nr:hypothetical protein [Shouchella patagoniensis]